MPARSVYIDGVYMGTMVLKGYRAVLMERPAQAAKKFTFYKASACQLMRISIDRALRPVAPHAQCMVLLQSCSARGFRQLYGS